jgi:hypothetical protein
MMQCRIGIRGDLHSFQGGVELLSGNRGFLLFLLAAIKLIASRFYRL